MELDLPYKIEYCQPQVKGNCKKCRKKFFEGVLRIADMVQSKTHDGKDPVWFHSECFFQTYHPKFTDEIENFEGIKYDDQLKILTKMDPKFETLARKRAAEAEEPLDPADITNFGIEYATSNDDNCFFCKEQILRNEIRIKKTVYDTDIAARFGKEILWNHMHCFVIQRNFYAFQLGGNTLPGFDMLQPAHQVIIKEALPSLITNVQVKEGERSKKMYKLSDNAEHEPKSNDDMNLEETIAKQNAELMRVRQALKKVCSLQELELLLMTNDSGHVEGLENLLDRCADLLTFGALYKCQKCFKGDMIFSKHGYTCNSSVDEWVMCGYFDEKPLRLKCIIPTQLREKDFFATCEPAIEHRAVRPLVLKEDEAGGQVNDVAHSSKSMPSYRGKKKETQLKVESIKLKNGTAVDPKSKLEHIAHVYNQNGRLYTCVLGLTDITKNKNSYYKLQVLESDVPQPVGFWVFSSWGRIGTNIGTSKVVSLASSYAACAKFEELYMEQTGNPWNSPEASKKHGKFYPIDVSYDDVVAMNTDIPSKLSPGVQELMKLLFDVKNMKMTMKEFHLDLEKMPLGKLSVRQFQAAYIALTELEDSLNKSSAKMELLGLSNKFYTLIPHNFGLAKAPIIDTFEKINEKREMVDSLLDIQTAFTMMTKGGASQDVNTFDAYYNQLKADVVLLDSSSQEFGLIDQYMRNTQAHGYRIKILEVFKVNRHGEEQRYQPFKDLHNRQLLWHGSRLTNFASIISNGLKICAQVNGSMFGRGIYFADMVSKSANYCIPSPPANVMMLALCEVALGNMQNLLYASNIVQPAHGSHSVKGVGETYPDPCQSVTRPDGVVIPLGTPTNDATVIFGPSAQQSGARIVQPVPAQGPIPMQAVNQLAVPLGGLPPLPNPFGGLPPLPNPMGRPAGGLAPNFRNRLMFNEYIVYNEAQVKIQYLVKAKRG